MIVGVIVLIDGVQNLAAAGYVLIRAPDELDAWSYVWSREREGLINGVVRTAAGTLLITGRDAMVRGWSRLRGLPASYPADADDSE